MDVSQVSFPQLTHFLPFSVDKPPVGDGTVGQNGDQGPADGGGMEGGPTKRQSNSPVVDSDNHLEKVVVI
jgi:hypothetical protein